MNTRLLLLLAPLLLPAACGDPKASRQEAEAAQAAGAGGDDRIDCAVNGAVAFERVCSVERESGADGLILTVRHPSGGFRRLKVTRDGRGVIPADGAEGATVTILDDRHIEVAIGTDRYHLPATVGK
ncbi:MAG: hypothetical protein JOZ90_03615 [Alphaproteobacteria bacterium]|nr:hypothetical protein [Alphaproteobacteria bacterium]MBV9370613.1 hypothetical protein [Alphaproteobacteria bacterium]MBV9900167.1 hypothetical protein [Alphaproteobacteria bacterium]